MPLGVWKKSYAKAIATIIVLWGVFACISYSAKVEVAIADTSAWAYPLNSPASFDFASKMEMLAFVRHFQAIQNLDDNALRAYIQPKVKNPNLDSIRAYFARMQTKILSNFGAITEAESKREKLSYDFLPSLTPPIRWADVLTTSQYAMDNLPTNLTKWQENTEAFYTQYLLEQVRLAALFPRITSEILPLGKLEILGDEIPDKHFVLTFDDGPTLKGGNTDRLITLLENLKIQAMFFVLGENLSTRGDVGKLYANMIVGYHGDVHKPHTKLEIYHNVPAQSQKVATLGSAKHAGHCYFRPPYGQRDPHLLQMLEEAGCKVVLWNIDSQDWGNISPEQIYDRILTLTLLWRSGIILFHDVHSKSYKILPRLVQTLRECGVEFENL